jgi:CelD/BcsL family acetyltransferase involved in cellulose biosynthesis
MADPQYIVLDSAAKIRACAADWDDLWRRSDLALPIARAEYVAHWIETFAPRSKVHCLTVRQDGRFVAAIPFVGQRLKRLLPVGSLPANAWAWAGDLLVDRAADADQIAATLAAVIARLPWPLVRLDGVPLDAPAWQAFVEALKSAGQLVDVRDSFEVNRIAIDHDWTAYRASWSGNHRRQMGKMLRRAEREGGVKLHVYRALAPGQVEPFLQRGFAVEDRSWKSAARSSVLKNPRMFDYLCAEARQLAQRGELQLTFLEHRGQTIAFEYGWNAAGVYGAAKVGYDEAYANLTPGQLLRYLLLELMFADPAQRLVDFLGPATDATSRWSTGRYRVGRIVAGNQRIGGRLAARFYHRWLEFRTRQETAVGGRSEADGPKELEQTEAIACR